VASIEEERTFICSIVYGLGMSEAGSSSRKSLTYKAKAMANYALPTNRRLTTIWECRGLYGAVSLKGIVPFVYTFSAALLIAGTGLNPKA